MMAGRPALRLAWLGAAALMCAGFLALGSWQLLRLQWKLDLIARVGQRVHAAPVAAPDAARWPRLTAEADAYRRVSLDGVWLAPLSTRVQASTELGSGFWLLTPMCRPDGSVVLVNRGFVTATAGDWKASTPAIAPAHVCDPQAGARGMAGVTGLLRMSEPGGGALRRNDPAANRWYSRDVAAIAAAHGLRRVAPYFIDAEAAPMEAGADPSRHPVGGLTVISFHNNHLVYALTWYALALMAAAACLLMTRDKWKKQDGATK